MAVTLTDIETKKRLVTVGNNEVFYEDLGVAAGKTTELAAANGDIDTTDQLEMFEGYQKVFIANGENLKVADFVNTKLTHAALDTAHAKADILTQDQGDSKYAYMIVDFTNTAKTATYGFAYYAGSATAFTTDDAITGSGSGSGFTPTGVTASPHWYDWAVYPGGASGTMPDVAYLGCLYRGRCVLSGNIRYPNQWYMSKAGDPWDWAYDSTDPLSAVAGSNADAAESPAIVRALMPYKDDYLIFGCANSMWVMEGDPAEGGSLACIDSTTGIFGARSWCFDNSGNCYFLGTGGIYRIPVGFTYVENISLLSLPNLIADEALDPSIHRASLAYDPKRHGVLISIVTVSSGANSNYWYDLRTEGFFPESYATNCGPYALFYYAANNEDYRELLVGGKDGYIRHFKDSAKDDDNGASDTAISSYMTLPIVKTVEDDDTESKLTSLTFVSAGGASNGAFSDIDGFTWQVYGADDAETCLEDIKDGATANASGTISTTGRQNRDRSRVRGQWLGIKIYNSTSAETWTINSISGNIVQGGKIR